MILDKVFRVYRLGKDAYITDLYMHLDHIDFNEITEDIKKRIDSKTTSDLFLFKQGLYKRVYYNEKDYTWELVEPRGYIIYE